MIKHAWKKWRRKCKAYLMERRCKKLKKEIGMALSACQDAIPCFIISYNNGIYVRNTVDQLTRLGLTPIIVDNNSTDNETLQVLRELSTAKKAFVAASDRNFGHLVGFLEPVYAIMPEVFAYTDPDLQFNANLPNNFLSVLSELTAQYSVFKAGFALDLLPEKTIVDLAIHQSNKRLMNYSEYFSLREHEGRNWRKKIVHDCLTVYSAPIDTTFAVYRKSNYRGDFYDAVRVAGDYGAIHLPWFPELDLFTDRARTNYLKGNKSSTSIVAKDVA